jgi:hypothetical protein
MSKRILAAAFVAFLAMVPVTADTPSSSSSTTPVPVPYGPDEFPQWQKDLRRTEILSFGALPFVTFFSSIFYDSYRYFSHDQQEGYLPWPFKKSESAVALSEDEQKKILLASAGISVGIALFDLGYRSFRREMKYRRLERENRGRHETIDIVPVDSPTSGSGN